MADQGEQNMEHATNLWTTIDVATETILLSHAGLLV